MQPWLALILLCLLTPAMFGCDQISGSGLVQIIGEVRMDRKPLADAMVAFIPLEYRNSHGKIREIAFGRTDNTGRFEISTSDAKGVSPTDYRVLFFRPDDVENGKNKSLTKTEPDEKTLAVRWLQDALLGTEIKSQSLMKVPEINVGDIPTTYNVESILRCKVKVGAGILYPKFNLQSHPDI